MTQPQVIISEDLSGVGQVSLGVALPVLAALGFNCAVLPTAYLSTHTGGLGQPVVTDLAAQIAPTSAHWQTLPLQPQGVLLGYLGKTALAAWQQVLPDWHAAPVRLLDPAMADGGRLYAGFDAAYVAAMRELIPQASGMTPNLTEAQLLLGQEPDLAPRSDEGAAELATQLVKTFGVQVLVTGIPLLDGSLAVAGCTDAAAPAWVNRNQRLPGHYFGTGDLFAAVVCAALMRGQTLQHAAILGANFVARAIQQTDDPRLGLNFAAGLPWLSRELEEL